MSEKDFRSTSGAGRVIVIGAGIGGLATALRLSSAGLPVTVLERHSHPGGKIRVVPSAAGPVNAGPTVFTMRPVFEDLFASAGARLEDHVTIQSNDILARHWWEDGAHLDLFANRAQSVEAIRHSFGATSAREFTDFCDRAKALYDAFEGPVMHAAQPQMTGVAKAAMAGGPRLMRYLAPTATLARALKTQFSDPHLRQLFGRYATYVGGAPELSPAVLALIWQSEAAGVWTIKGGMHALATAIAELAACKGATFHYNAHVERIETSGGQVTGVSLAGGVHLAADHVVFNGDLAALGAGLLGETVQQNAPKAPGKSRSHSAYVWTFAARPTGRDLTHHNVFFAGDPADEFGPLSRGEMPTDGTLYLCAQDRGFGDQPDLERFQVIMNGPAVPAGTDLSTMEATICQTRVFQKFARMGLSFSPQPATDCLTTPAGFDRLFPASGGALYGQSPHGVMSTFQRPVSRTRLPGLYLAGGGVHPGPGIPMATLSGKHAAEAILSDHASTSRSRKTVTPGGTWTGFPMMGRARSRS